MKRSDRLRRRAMREVWWLVLALVLALGAGAGVMRAWVDEGLVILLPVVAVVLLVCVVVAVERAVEAMRLLRQSWEESLYEYRRSIRWNDAQSN